MRAAGLISLVAILLYPAAVCANAGMENIAYSAKSAGMGGTSIAVGDDTSVMNTNPAAISKIDGRRIDMNIETMFPMFSFENPVNDTDGNHPIYLIPSAGLVWHDPESRWSFGMGMYNEGGTGTDYGLLRVNNDVMGSGIGITDIEYYSQFGYMKVTPTVAYTLTDTLSVALSPNVGYSTMRIKMPFYEPSMNRFWAADMDGDDISLSARVGLLYKPSDDLGFGIAYATPADIDIKGDVTMTAPTGDIPGMPQQSLMKGDLEMNIGWPQSIKAGVFRRMKGLGGLLLAFDVEWLNWSAYYDKIPVKMTRVTLNGSPTSDRTFEMRTDWNDQWVFKLGVEYPVTERLSLRTGYVYGKNPVPPQGALAVMNPFVEHHITGGLGYSIGNHFEFNASVVYGIQNDVEVGDSHNISPDMVNSTTGMEFVSMSMMLSYKW
ncbi:MAG: outer membrane protein transport protein [Deltaproteobacteria bacterium]|nr:outer membrane protein transport protein [Deltaproteobacteria bacterium]